MSTDIEIYEDEDIQQAHQVDAVDDREVQAILDTIVDRLRAESLTLVEYIRETLRASERATWMPTCTAIDIGAELARWTQQACDDRDGMIAGIREAR